MKKLLIIAVLPLLIIGCNSDKEEFYTNMKLIDIYENLIATRKMQKNILERQEQILIRLKKIEEEKE